MPVQVHHKTIRIQNVEVFYREAGLPESPAILLLHGFGASSYMFRELMPALADEYRLVAPDLPGFGHTQVLDSGFEYTFDHLAAVTDAFTQSTGLERYALYVFDYGAPVGWRLAVKHPHKITAIVSQNGNAYEEGLSAGWADMREVWSAPTAERRAALRRFSTPEMIKWQYTEGVEDTSLIAPETYQLASAAIDRHGVDAQLDLICDYGSNLRQYAQLHEYFRHHQPPTLVIWGSRDPFFTPDGARAFQRDNPNAEVRLLDTGHFALETHGREIATAMREFLGRSVVR